MVALKNLFQILVGALFVCSFEARALPEVKDAQRIVALSPHSVELLYALGVGDRIVATTEFADYPEEANHIERIGGYHGIQTERIMELKPDLIVAWEGGNRSEDLALLASLGLPVYRSETKRLRHIADEVLALGKMTGKETQAQQLVQSFHQQLDELTRANKDKAPVTFFYQLWAAPLRTISTASWINEMLAICGGQNITTDTELGYPQVSLESVLLGQPQAIIIPSQHGHDNGEISGLDWNQWPEIPAVKNQHIYRINGDILHRFSLRVVDATQELCNTFDKVRQTK